MVEIQAFEMEAKTGAVNVRKNCMLICLERMNNFKSGNLCRTQEI
jgi:hypothetical protein